MLPFFHFIKIFQFLSNINRYFNYNSNLKGCPVQCKYLKGINRSTYHRHIHTSNARYCKKVRKRAKIENLRSHAGQCRHLVKVTFFFLFSFILIELLIADLLQKLLFYQSLNIGKNGKFKVEIHKSILPGMEYYGF